MRALVLLLASGAILSAASVSAQEVDWQMIDATLGRKPRSVGRRASLRFSAHRRCKLKHGAASKGVLDLKTPLHLHCRPLAAYNVEESSEDQTVGFKFRLPLRADLASQRDALFGIERVDMAQKVFRGKRLVGFLRQALLKELFELRSRQGTGHLGPEGRLASENLRVIQASPVGQLGVLDVPRRVEGQQGLFRILPRADRARLPDLPRGQQRLDFDARHRVVEQRIGPALLDEPGTDACRS